MVLLREEIGDVLREQRRQQSRTLREVSAKARVSLGYLSEVERGQKEASSELLASICGALDVSLSTVLTQVSARFANAERLHPKAGVNTAGLPPRPLAKPGHPTRGVAPALGARRPGERRNPTRASRLISAA